MQAKNANFFYTMELNTSGQLKIVFLVHSRSKMACNYFRDVVIFDSMYLTNTSNAILSFAGVNHHRQSILLGYALLSDEMIKNFKWVFKSWLDANGG